MILGLIIFEVWNGQNLASEKKNDITTAYTYDPTGIVMSNDGTDTVRFIKDPHGNVVTTSKNDKIVDSYDYTAFGVQLNSAETSNPFRYCGEYYDEELDSVYLRNRYYQPTIGRFINEDPVKDGLNWYNYCAGNPVMMIDPSGLIVTSQKEYADTIKSLLQELTDDEIDYKEEFDENGQSKGIVQFIITKTHATDRHVGQTLVYDLINDPKTVNVNIGTVVEEDENGYEVEKTWCMYTATETSPAEIYINPNDVLGMGEKSTYVQQDDGTIIAEEFPDYIQFGHELVHTWRDFKGIFNYSKDKVAVIPFDLPKMWPEEEMQTMGINYCVNAEKVRNYKTYNGIISENGLRIENGLNLRVSYFYAQ